MTVYAVHPGIVRTDLKRHMNLGLLCMWKMVRPFTKTSAQGAQTPIYCAVEPALDSHSGGYYRYLHSHMVAYSLQVFYEMSEVEMCLRCMCVEV